MSNVCSLPAMLTDGGKNRKWIIHQGEVFQVGGPKPPTRPPPRPTHRSAAAPVSLGFVRVTQKNVCSKNGRRRHDLYGHYAGNYVMLHHYMVTTKAFVGTSLNVFSLLSFLYMCVCGARVRVCVYTSLGVR